MKLSFLTKLFFISGVVFISFIFAHPSVAFAAIPVGNVLSDTTLDSSSTYVVDGTPTIVAGATLTIPAGTQLIFTPGSTLAVHGSLVTKGTASKHVAIIGGTAPPFIPFATALATVAPSVQSRAVDTPDIASAQSPEVTETPQVDSIMMGTDDSLTAQHLGIAFLAGSTSTLAYTDISDGLYGAKIETGATATLSHVTFTNCDTGILGSGGTLKLTSNTFDTVDTPVSWDFHGTFTHSNTTFTNTGFPGWLYGGDVLGGETMRLNSTDGEYEIPSVTAGSQATLEVSPGVTIHSTENGAIVVDGGSLLMDGTTDKPITVYGDGICQAHTPIISMVHKGIASIEHVQFHDLCSGIQIDQSSVKMLDTKFEDVAGPVLFALDNATVTSDTMNMQDVYQAIKAYDIATIKISNTDIDTVNGEDAALAGTDQAVFSVTNSSIQNAKNCIEASDNSSLTADGLTMTHCSDTAIKSNNDSNNGTPSGFIVTNSDISQSGTAFDLTQALVVNVSNNKIHDNTVGVSLHDMPKTTLINNDWGSTTGPSITGNPEGKGDSIIFSDVPQVVYRPWIGMDSLPAHNPIIIVPGITGSVLTKDYDDKSELWPNITKLALSFSDSFLDDLELLQSGVPSATRPVVVGDIIRSASSVDIFTSMIAALTKDGYTEGKDLFVLPYDWRLSNTTNEALLNDAIKNALTQSGATKVNIIAHSMGGLLVEDYLAQHATAPIDHLFYIAVPHLGAPKAFKTLMYGDDMGFNFSIGSILKIPLLNADTVKIIAQNMPSIYELLPSQKYLTDVDQYVRDLSQPTPALAIADINKYMIADGRNSKMFAFAQKLHDVTDTFSNTPGTAFDFIGCGSTKTITSFTLTKEQSMTLTGLKVIPEHRIVYGQGDGVVPTKSAAAAINATNYYISGGSHGTMPSVKDVQTAILDILDGTEITPSTTLSTTAKNCSAAGDVVEVHSPVTLDIYDDQGRHTGPTDTGDIELGIPNVQYDTIGDEKFAFLPSGPTYKVVNHAEAVGSYDMYISHTDENDTITQQTYFHAIPLTSTKTVGTVLIGPAYDPSIASYEVDADEDGDGNVESIFYPVSSYSTPEYINDVIPPVTTATVSDQNTVTLSAHDDVTGVLDTKYSTDGTTWNTYTVPFQVADGTTVQFLSIDRNGNTEDIQSLTVGSADSTSGNNDPVGMPPSQDGDTQTAQTPADTITSGATATTTSGGGGGGSYYPPSDSDNATDTTDDDNSEMISNPDTSDQDLDQPIDDNTDQSDADTTVTDTSIPPTPEDIKPQKRVATATSIPKHTPPAILEAAPKQLLASAGSVITGKRRTIYLAIAALILIGIISIFIKKRY